MSVLGGSLARRYARAIIEIAKEEGLVEKFAEELASVDGIFHESKENLRALSNDFFDLTSRLAAMKEITEKVQLHPLLANFLLVLVQKERIGFPADVAREYQRMSDDLLGIARVTVTGPKTPDTALLERVEKILKEKIHKKIIATGEASPEIIGGLLLKVDHKIYDGSLRNELRKLKTSMLND